MAMFPDTVAESEEVPGTQMMPEKQTNLQRMAQPAQILRAAVQNLVNYQVAVMYICNMLSCQHRVMLN